MSQPRITLRPPPNIDFVQGYPGIPSGAPDRPQAAVKGAIEFRVNGQVGIKAKWVRVELRKVETLPGGGLMNTFFDFVGQSPISVWQSNEEYNELTSMDFPFYIRIPESIPPSIALEKGAGVKYELIATICVKGKKGFLRRDKPNILSQSTPIVIDKHELHTTWPVYTQPEGRKLTLDNVTLTVERTHTCYGPGDKITVMAAVKSESLNTVILRGFEFSLRETTVFRSGPNTPGKKGQPQIKVTTIAEQKVPVNATLYGGTHHKAELTVSVPSHHTSTTLNSARHIDINYVLVVKALMGTGKPLSMELPVIVSNWPRNVSVEAVKRIGLAPNVASHLPGAIIAPPPPTTMAIDRPSFSPQAHPYASPTSEISGITGSINDTISTARFATSPSSGGYGGRVNEWGVTTTANEPQTISGSQVGPTSGMQSISEASSSSGTAMQSTTFPPAQSSTGSQVRPRSSGRATTSRPLTVANYNENNPEEADQAQQAAQVVANARSHARQQSLQARAIANNVATASSRNQWISAEDEKKRLYENAVAQVEKTQEVVCRGPNAPVSESYSSSQAPYTDAGPVSATTAASVSRAPSAPSPPQQKKWPTAEEEKTRLFNEAQAAARRLQGLDDGDGPTAGGSSYVSHSPPRRVGSPQGSTTSAASAGAALYQQAMSSINRPVPGQSSHSHSNSQSHSQSHTQPHAGVSKSASPPTTPRTPKSPAPNYPTAEEEKAALRRYHDAKAAVDRGQTATYYAPPHSEHEPPHSAPISYDALYPPPPPAPVAAPPPTNGDLPPAFDQGSSSQPQPVWISEKEKLKRAYEAHDAAALAAQRQPPPPVNGDLPPAFDQGQSSNSQPPVWMSEKEKLRRAYEVQDAAAGVHASPALSAVGVGRNGPIYTQPQPPLPTTTPPPSQYGPPPPAPNFAPPPPPSSTSQPYNSAAAEKERLKRMYEVQDAVATASTPPAPPPPRSRPGTTTNGTTGGRPMPQPRAAPVPPGGSGSQPLSAAEEKARLRAMYDAEDREANGLPAPIPYSQLSPHPNGLHRLPSFNAPFGTPPPLAPRPPKEYIQETREEDARLDSRLRAIDYGNGNGNSNGNGSVDTHHSGSSGPHKLTPFVPDSLNRSETDLRPPLPAKKLYID
ncbi:hypothetical protein QCA50_003512 [Cerrena zonata]|uniref:Arrestin C-terminal-like domain-containing protein n=1 Tax=Cerrena zonata TaxID=2478898 RepID=A0AAW0GKQ8_9APHY